MHNCKTTRNNLIDLALDETQVSTSPPASTTPSGMAPQPSCSAGDPALPRWGPRSAGGSDKSAQLLAELEECSACRAEYASLRRTLSVVVQTTRSTAPAESFWTGYHSRLSQRIKSAASAKPIADAFEPRTSDRAWSTLKEIAGASVRIPVPVAAILFVFFGLSMFLVMQTRGQSKQKSATPVTAIETRTVEVPVIKEKVVTRVVYVKRNRRLSPAQPDPIRAPGFSGTTARLGKEALDKAAVSLSGFRPTDQVKLTIIKGSYHDEK